MKDKLFATQALSQTQKNVSEPQTGIEPVSETFFWVCDKAWVANSFPLIYQAASLPSYIYTYERCFKNTAHFASKPERDKYMQEKDEPWILLPKNLQQSKWLKNINILTVLIDNLWISKKKPVRELWLPDFSGVLSQQSYR